MGGKPTETGVQPSTLQNMTVPAFMPGQQSLLANQMNAGFGSGDQAGLLAMQDYLGSMYRPMSVPMVQNAADIAALKKLLDARNSGTTGASTGSGSTGGTPVGGLSGYPSGGGVR